MEEKKDKKVLMTEQEVAQSTARAARNKKTLIIAGIVVAAVIVVAGAVFAWYTISSNKANDAIGLVDIEQNDSIRNVKYKQIADDGNYDANKRAKLMVAIQLYNDSNYQEAINYLDEVSVSSDIIGAGIQSLKGDCHVNLKKYDEALECYEKAVSIADNNPVITPFVLQKMANVYAEKKAYDKEFECYETIRRDYPDAINDIDKYYERAKTRAGK